MAHDEIGAHDGIYGSGVGVGATGALAGDPDTAASFTPPGSVKVGDGFAFKGMATFSVEAWIKPATTDGYSPVMSDDVKADGGAPGLGWDLFLTPTGGLRFERLYGATRDGLGTPSALATTRFTHAVVTYDGAQLMLYTDGVQVGAQPSTGALPSVDSLFVIGAEVGGVTDTTHFHGVIDEVAVYDHALAPGRVAIHHQTGVEAL